jgi:acetyl esterase/lipase
VIINFPRGPVETRGNEAPANLTPLALAANKTVVRVHYRLSKERRYPTPIHDALAGYDWVLKHLVEGHNAMPENEEKAMQGRIGVCGELIGGSLAAAVGLTECHAYRTGVSAMLLSNPVADWTSMHPINVPTPTLLTPSPSPEPKKRGGKRKPTLPSWEKHAQHTHLSTTSLIRARTTLFKNAGDYFDPFASPLLFFKTPSTEVPGDIDPLEELFAEMEGIVRPQDKKRKSARVYPQKGSDLNLPMTMTWLGRESVLADQVQDLRKSIAKAAGPGKTDYALREGIGFWDAKALWEVGRWFALAFEKRRS